MLLRKLGLSIISVMLAILVLIFSSSFQLAYAFDKSRLLASVVLVSSVSLKFYGVNLDKSANQAYDEYLHTARQAEIKRHLNDYEDKRARSLLINRISSGMAAFALLYSIFDEIAQEKEIGEKDLGKGFEKGIWERDLGKNYLFHCSIASHSPDLFPGSLSQVSFPNPFPRSLSIIIVATKDF